MVRLQKDASHLINPLYFNILCIQGDSGPERPSNIARAVCTRTTVSTALKALHKRQFLEFKEDEDDKRATRSARGDFASRPQKR